MIKQAADTIYIVTITPERAEAIRQVIVLRGFDEINCVLANDAERLLQETIPALLVLDLEGQTERLEGLLRAKSPSVKALVLAEQFDENLFLICHDYGVRDYMTKPVPDSYLVSRVIQALQGNRLEQLVQQKDRILVEMGVLSAASGVFTTFHLLKLLKQYTEQRSVAAQEPLSFLVIQLEGYTSPLLEEWQNPLWSAVGAILKECSRGQDMVGEYFMDKFAVILPNTGRRGATALAKRLATRLNGLVFEGPNGSQILGAKIGLAEYGDCRHYEELLNRALDNLKNPNGASGNNLHQI